MKTSENMKPFQQEAYWPRHPFPIPPSYLVLPTGRKQDLYVLGYYGIVIPHVGRITDTTERTYVVGNQNILEVDRIFGTNQN